jgi:hypothetical protein
MTTLRFALIISETLQYLPWFFHIIGRNLQGEFLQDSNEGGENDKDSPDLRFLSRASLIFPIAAPIWY